MTEFADQKLPAHDWRLSAAREVAQWELGDPSWADLIIAAYCAPHQALERIEEERAA